MRFGAPTARLRRPAIVAAAGLAAISSIAVLSSTPANAVGPGSLVSWGFNNQGQLGDGTTTARDLPVDVALPAGVTITQVEGASQAHSLAITSDGALLAWGNNNQGQLGDGTHTDRHTPVSVDLSILNVGETITDIAAGQDSSYAVTSDGRGLAWGNNFWGNLGNGTTVNSDTPVEIALPAGETLVDIAAGYDHGLGLTADGEVLAWGYGGVGSLGIGTTATHHNPVYSDLSTLDPGETVTDIKSMTHHNIALTSAGRVIGWGDNQWGQVGDGTQTQRRTPVLVNLPGGVSVTAIGVGWDHSLAVTSDGQGIGWGTDDYGQLGDGGTTPVVQTSVVSMDLPAGVQLAAVDGGVDHTVALTTDGDVLAFGYGGSGQMGNGTTTAVNPSPVAVTLAAGTTVHDIDAGIYHNLAVADVNSDPTVTISSPVEGATVEYGDSVIADYACADAEGIASCVGPVADGAAIDTGSLGAKSFTVTATDTSGATASKTVNYTVVDTNKPEVTLTTPAEGATYVHGADVKADYSCTDELLDTCVGDVADGASIDTATVGAKTFTVTGTDSSGNETIVTHSYTVTPVTGHCSATAVRVGGLRFASANAAGDPCAAANSNLLTVTIPLGLQLPPPLSALNGGITVKALEGTTSKVGNTFNGTASVSEVKIVYPLNAWSFELKNLHSEATATVPSNGCGSPAGLSGNAEFGTMKVNGKTYNDADRPSQLPLGLLGTIRFNSVHKTANSVQTHPLLVDLPGNLLDVAIGEAKAGLNC